MLNISVHSEICFTALEHPTAYNWAIPEKDFRVTFSLEKNVGMISD